MDKPRLQKQIGNNVRHYHMERKLTQEELASMVNVNATAITRIEDGQRMMRVMTLQAVADALGVSCDALLYKDGNSLPHDTNIYRMLSAQSDESLAHLEKIIQACISEYGDAMKS